MRVYSAFTGVHTVHPHLETTQRVLLWATEQLHRGSRVLSALLKAWWQTFTFPALFHVTGTQINMWTQICTLFTYSIVCVMLRMPCTHAHTVKETHPSTEPTIWISSWICQLPAQARVSQLYCTAGGLRFKQQQQLSPPVEQEWVTLTGLQQAELQSNL